MAQSYFFPPIGSNTSVGANGGTSPTSSTLVAGQNPTGLEQPLQTTANGDLKTYIDAINPTAKFPVDIEQVLGTAVGPANPVPAQLSNGSVVYDARQIRALVNTTDSVNIGNFPATQPVSGTVAVSSISGSLPAGTNNLGSVNVANFPATQPVSGTVTVSSITNPLPTGTNALGSVSVSNFPANQTVNGTVNVGNTVSDNLTQINGTAISSTNALPVNLATGGTLYDARQIRALTSADVVTANQGASPYNDNISQWGGTATSLGAKVSASSVPVVLATDQASLSTKSPVNVSGSLTQLAATTTNQTVTPPTNAVGFILENDSTSADSIRYRIGAAATATQGLLAEPGRDSGFIPCAATINIICLTSTASVAVQWILSA